MQWLALLYNWIRGHWLYALSAAPLVPIAARSVGAVLFPRARKRALGETRRTDEHRGIIVALAGFSLAGIAIIGSQTGDKYALPLFDITVSFLCYLGALGVQAWKDLYWQDAIGDALRDAATTAMLVFIVRFTVCAEITRTWAPLQHWIVVTAALVAWIFDPGVSIWIFWTNWRDTDGQEKH